MPMMRILTFAAFMGGSTIAHAQEAITEIGRATYGYAGDRKDISADLTKLCAGKPACEFRVENGTFKSSPPEDPSPGNSKGVIVTYKCGATEKKHAAAENRTAKLSCP